MTARLPVVAQMEQKRNKRKVGQDLWEQATDEGWRFLDPKVESLRLIPETQLAKPFTFNLGRPRSITRLLMF
jgi:hypothetical protein